MNRLPALLAIGLLLANALVIVPVLANPQAICANGLSFETGQPFVHAEVYQPQGVPSGAIPQTLPPGLEYPPDWQPQGSEWGRIGQASIERGCARADVPVGGRLVDMAQLDIDGDGIGDAWAQRWAQVVQGTLAALDDLDNDGLTNLKEYQWGLLPVCVPYNGFQPDGFSRLQNCRDFEASETTGLGGDDWLDGAEVAYWDGPAHAGSNVPNVAFTDPDAALDSDGDGRRNVEDHDSDNDGLPDGLEATVYFSYPEERDSDCAPTDAQCSSPAQAGMYARQGHGGTGDGIDDAAEAAAWLALSPNALLTDFDDDGIASNLLDPDADGDGLLDGQEFLLGKGQARPDVFDTDGDGLPDGDHDGVPGNEEVAWSEDTDLDGLINLNDPDSDNDGMPDAWEVEHGFGMIDPSDAVLDRDGDLLSNLGEYLNGSDPLDIDTDNDQWLDGEEVITHLTSPTKWDTDGDGMPDSYEGQRGFNPRSFSDGAADPDADSFDTNRDGSADYRWTNVREYGYGKPATFQEIQHGPWHLGTDPRNPDTDGDGASDGYEAYYGTGPFTPADTTIDEDGDGLSFAEELIAGTNFLDADTDGDGLCDGGQAANCTRAGFALAFQPGERDYGTRATNTDSDDDGLSDRDEVARWDPSNTGRAIDLDGDGLSGPLDTDSDGDGLIDGQEVNWLHSRPDSKDTDGDRLDDGAEVNRFMTSPTDTDSDDDGLDDGNEVNLHGTRPNAADTDGDLLGDGVEIRDHQTDPLRRDTDGDGMPDGWEILEGTLPRVGDGTLDLDGDQLANLVEHQIGTRPRNADTDSDGMPDGYEHAWQLGPRSSNANGDADGDLLANLDEYLLDLNPRVRDTDGDFLVDGAEFHTYGTDPKMPDSDRDGLRDGIELLYWTGVASNAWSVNYDGDRTTNNLLDLDSDADQLTDREEFVVTKTKPYLKDSDGDGLSDFDEVTGYDGRFDPNDADTDDDGRNDAFEAGKFDPTKDFDMDGLTNGEEGQYGTDPGVADTDCDGIKDGTEKSYWGSRWQIGGNRLLRADVDQDGVKDGVEIGAVGSKAISTNPEVSDTDGDGLNDGAERHNTAQVACQGQAQASAKPVPSVMPTGPVPVGSAPSGVVPSSLHSSIPELGGIHFEAFGALAGVPLVPALQVDDGLEQAMEAAQDVAPLVTPQDSVEPSFIVGAYGVRFFTDGFASPSPMSAMAGPGGTAVTDPLDPDSDGDGLWDGDEVFGTSNPYKDDRHDPNGFPGNTDPLDADSDDDGILDGAEVGIAVPGVPWAMNPNREDTDNDDLLDGSEDVGRDGARDLDFNAATGRYTVDSAAPGAPGVASNPTDADTDDDGIRDDVELLRGSRTSVLDWDSDRDGLSDGLETGVAAPVSIDGLLHTRADVTVFGLANWKTWQPFMGAYTGGTPLTTLVDVADSDQDGIIDGLEDLNRNGVFGEADELNARATPDTDGDSLLDGRELLIAGQYTFQDFVVVHPDPESAMQYTGAPFTTDPLNNNTDSMQGDIVPDGKDIDPRGNGFLRLKLDRFWQYDAVDFEWWTDAQYHTDLVVGLTVETGAGSYKVRTLPLNDFGRREGGALIVQPPQLDEGSLENPPTVWSGALSAIKIVDTARDTIQFDLPDNIDDFSRAKDLKVRLRIDGFDADDDWGSMSPDANPDDLLDISGVAGMRQYFDGQGFDLTAGALGGGNKVPALDANGNADQGRGDENDARLIVGPERNLMPYHLLNALGTPASLGTCFAGVDSQGAPCLK